MKISGLLRKIIICSVISLFVNSVSAGESDSSKPLSGTSRAPARLVKHDFSPEVEAVLSVLESKATSEESHLVIDWVVSPGFSLNPERDGIGLRNFKSSLNWYWPIPTGSGYWENGSGYWENGSLIFSGKGADFRLLRPKTGDTPGEWWQKEGEYLNSSRMSELSSFIIRWHAIEALESGMLHYPDGIGLVLMALRPGEYLRRAENLELGEKVIINDVSYQTLLATPEWIQNPFTLENRANLPDHYSTLLSWAENTPKVTYYLNEKTNEVEGINFKYFKLLRSHPGKWDAGNEASGIEIESWVTEWKIDTTGVRFPVKIDGTCYANEVVKRRIAFTVSSEAEKSEETTAYMPLDLQRGRRVYEPWPPYQSSVLAVRIAAGENSYVNRVGLVQALAFEWNLSTAFPILKSLIEDFNNDKELIPESMYEIDYHLGIAVYEYMRNPNVPESELIWNSFELTALYSRIFDRACEFYRNWVGTENSQSDTYFNNYFNNHKVQFGARAKMLFAMNRQLIDRVETEADRALELEQLLKDVTEEDARLAAIRKILDIYLSNGEFDSAMELMKKVRGLLVFVAPENIQKFMEEYQGWLNRINEVMAAKAAKEKAERIDVLKEELRQHEERLEKAIRRGRTDEVERVRSLIRGVDTKVAELKK